MATRIELTIDNLMLHEMPAHKRQRVVAALEQELNRLIIENGLSFATLEYGLWLDHLPPFEVDMQLKPEQIGAAAAQKIYTMLKERGR
jgi:hypothetical protein